TTYAATNLVSSPSLHDALPIFGDPEELQRRLAEFAAQMQGQQRLAWADNAIKLAVDMTVAAVARVNVQGNAEDQAEQIRVVIARDRKSTRLNSSHVKISYAVFC